MPLAGGNERAAQVIQLRHIFWVLVSPTRGFAAVLARPRSGLVVLAVIGCALVAHLAVHGRIDSDAQQRLSAVELAQAQPGQEVSDEDVVETAQRSLNARRLGGYLFYFLGVPAALLVAGFVLWLLYGAWSEGLGYRRCFRLTAHLALPFGLRQLLSLPVIFSHPSIDPAATWGLFKTSLGALLGPAAFPGAWLMDPFWIWTGALTALAGRAMGRGWLRCTLVGLAFWGLVGLAGRGL